MKTNKIKVSVYFITIMAFFITLIPGRIFSMMTVMTMPPNNYDIRTQISNNNVIVETPLVKIEKTDNGLRIKSELYGEITLNRTYPNEKLFIDIVLNPYFLRLFRINQYGLSVFSNQRKKLFRYRHFYKYSRGDHSINMAIILMKYNRPIKEIICALLHDITHTKLSHLGDGLIRNIIEHNRESNNPVIKQIRELVNNNNEGISAIQDMIFEWYFEETGITEILNRHNISIENVLIKNNPVIKQSSPILCADNLEYTLTGAFLAGMLNKGKIEEIISSLRITNDLKWVFTPNAIETAKTLAYVSIKFDSMNSGSAWNAVMNFYGTILFEKAIELGIISIKELIFAPEISDEQIWEKITQSDDPEIKILVKLIKKPNRTFVLLIANSTNASFIKTKTRNINPYISGSGYLNNINTDFEEKYNKHFYNLSDKGMPVKIIDLNFLEAGILIEGY